MYSELVSIIIPTYGRPGSLINAVQSALNQSYKEIEILVVDDNSLGSKNQLDTERLLNTLNDKRIVYLKMEKNSGAALARNYAAKKSSGAFLCFLDDDDLFEVDKVKEQLEHMYSNDLDVSVCYITSQLNSKFNPSITIYPEVSSLKNFVLNGVLMNGMLMIKKELFIRVGGFSDTPRFQDHVLMFKVLPLNPAVGVLNKNLYTAIIHFEERISSGGKDKEGYKIRHYYEDNYRDLLSEEEVEILDKRQYLSLVSCKFNSGLGFKDSLLAYVDYLLNGKYSALNRLIYIIKHFLSRSVFLKKTIFYSRAYKFKVIERFL